jgi:hypothetical protein
MNRKSYLTTFLLIAVVVGFSLYAKKQSDYSAVEGRKITSTENSLKAQRMTKSESESPKDQASTILANDKTSSTTPNEIKALHENFPDKEKVNEDTISNPHTPSKTLMTFAKRLGPLMEKSFKDESTANSLVKELSSCANDESVAKAARAMCVTNTERLAKVHSNIEKTAKDLRASVSPEVQKILDTNDRFIKKQ